jgi:D-glycero-alpha-D-manno-heptose-7-phosphate kinase
VLAVQTKETPRRVAELSALCDIARSMSEVLTHEKDLDEFGRLLDCSWRVKKSLTSSISNGVIDGYYSKALAAGAVGGKLLGAGSGGFLLLYCEPNRQDSVRQALSDLTEVDFSLDPEGSKVIYVEDGDWNGNAFNFPALSTGRAALAGQA